MPQLHEERSELANALLKLVYGASVTIVGGAATYAGITGIDGGVLKQVWQGLQVPSPVISMGATAALAIVWIQWSKDRKEHRERTIDYIEGMNMAARLREKDMNENQKLRDKLKWYEQQQKRSRGR